MASYYISPPSSARPDLPATFESLNDDTLTTVLEFVGNKSYATYAGINKHCKSIYLSTKGMTKETFLFGYGSLSAIKDKMELAIQHYDWKVFEAVGKGIVYHNRREMLDWVLEGKNHQGKNIEVVRQICDVAAKDGRLDILKQVYNNIDDEDDKDRVLRGICTVLAREGKFDLLVEVGKDVEYSYNNGYIFGGVDYYAASWGKLDMLKWLENTKGVSIDKNPCVFAAVEKGHNDILEWIQKEKGPLEFNINLFLEAIQRGVRVNALIWLREQGCPWQGYLFHERTFRSAVMKCDLDVLQWLHDEGCPWPEHRRLRSHQVRDLKPEMIDWCHVNGYRNRIE